MKPVENMCVIDKESEDQGHFGTSSSIPPVSLAMAEWSQLGTHPFM